MTERTDELPVDEARGILGRFLAAATLAGVALLLVAVLGLLLACVASQGAYSVNPILSQSMQPTLGGAPIFSDVERSDVQDRVLPTLPDMGITRVGFIGSPAQQTAITAGAGGRRGRCPAARAGPEPFPTEPLSRRRAPAGWSCAGLPLLLPGDGR